MNIKKVLEELPYNQENMRFNDVEVDPSSIKAILINEIVPSDQNQDFYGIDKAAYLSTTIPLFQQAGSTVTSIQDILELGIYITNAVKLPKTEYTVSKESIDKSLPFLKKELSLFPNVKVIMLMGDVAKKLYNQIVKKETKKTIVPPISTYKLRDTKIYNGDIRIIPSYIMTGKNILIEKSKFKMASEDIATMLDIIMENRI